jgi:hypothetical protein
VGATSKHHTLELGVEIRRFLEAEQLCSHEMQLLPGLAEIAFPHPLSGKSVLAVRSDLGACCIEALRRGAAHAIGLELNGERLRQALKLARLLDLSPEYLRADIEEKPVVGPWDIIVCLNVLHQFRDPIGTLRFLALNTREHLIITVEPLSSLSANDRLVFRSPSFLRRAAQWVLNRCPLAYIEPRSAAPRGQRYSFTPAGLSRVLDGHMQLFQNVEKIKLARRDYSVLRCTRLKVDRMVVVAGACSSGKSWLCRRIARNEFNRELSLPDMMSAIRTSPSKIQKRSMSKVFPHARCPLALYHYDLSRIEGLGIYDYARDPATDLLRCAGELDCVLVAPDRSRLMRQLLESEFQEGQPREPWHQAYLELYNKPEYLARIYCDWIRFCQSVVPSARFVLYLHRDHEKDTGRMIGVTSASEAMASIRAVYG